jgi:GPI mannosyltransferase 3
MPLVRAILDAMRLAALERQVPGVPVRLSIAAALALHALTAWLHDGYYHPDEHYQILEFAWAKLGRAPFSTLPWEFAERIRPAIQPVIAAGAIRAFELAGVFSPFAAAFALRLASALLGLWVTIAVCARTVPAIRREWLKRFAFASSLFFWVAAAAHSRFSSENWGGLWLFAGLCLALDALDDADGPSPSATRQAWLSAGAGVAWGVALWCRFQMGIALAGIGAWMLFARRTPWRVAIGAALAGAAAVAASVCLDRWFYGAWVLTPLNYFRVNILRGTAASFGTAPAWVALAPFVEFLGPPLSFGFIAAVVAGCWYARRSPLVWAIVPFVAVHAAIAHKETRFMAPVIFGLLPLIAVSIDSLPEPVADRLTHWRGRRPGRVVAGVAWAANVAALVVVTLVPLDDDARLRRWLWDDSGRAPASLYSLNGAPYDDLLPMNYYRPPNLRVLPLAQLGRRISSDIAAGRRSLVLYEGTAPLFLFPPVPVDCRPLARSRADWLVRLDRSNWPLKRGVWTVCEATPSPSVPALLESK